MNARRMTADDYAEAGESVPNQALLCPVGACRRNGACMYANHPRCTVTAPEAPRCEDCGDLTGECGCAD